MDVWSSCLNIDLVDFQASANESEKEVDRRGFTWKSSVYLEELIRRLDNGSIKLIDVRDTSEIEETGSIPTSINIPRMINTFH